MSNHKELGEKEETIDDDENFIEPGKIEGFVLAGAMMMIYLILGGIFYAVGILVVEWVEYFDTDYRIVSWIGASHAMSLISAPVAGILMRRFGFRRCLVISAIVSSLALSCSAFASTLWIIYTMWILTGAALAFHNGPVLAYIIVRFRQYRSIVNAFMVSSISLGTIIFGVIINIAIEAYTWRGAVLIIGAVTLNLLPCGLVLRKWNKHRYKKDTLIIQKENAIAEIETKASAKDFPSPRWKNILDIEIVKRPSFIGVAIPIFLMYTAVSVVYIHLVSGFRILNKLTAEEARYLVPVLGCSNLVSRFIVSMITHYPRIDTFTLFIIMNTVLCLTVSMIPMFEGFTAAIILVVVLGIGLSGFSGLTHLVLADIIEHKYIAMAVQYLFLPGGLGYLLGAPLAGWIYDATNNYVYSFELSATLLALSILIMLPFWIKHVRRLKNKNLSKMMINREWIASVTSLA